MQSTAEDRTRDQLLSPAATIIRLEDGTASSSKGSQTCFAACGDFWNSSTTKGYFLSVTLILVGVGLVYLGTVIYSSYGCDDCFPDKLILGFYIFGGMLAGITYLTYLRFIFKTPHFNYWNDAAMSPDDVQQHIDEVHQACPRIVWTMTSFHKKNDKRKVTWTGQQDFIFSTVRDESPPIIDGLEEFQHTRVKFSKTFTFADPNTEAEFLAQRNDFIAVNLFRDELHEITVELIVPGYRDAVMASTSGQRPCFANAGLYALCTVLMLELPFGFLLRMLTGKRHFEYKKIFQCQVRS